MNNPLAKVLKAIAGVVVLVILVVTVNRWWGEYRTSDTPDTPANATSTAPPQGEGSSDAKPEGSQNAEETAQSKTVVVLTDGLNFRQEPSRDGKVIRGLEKGEKLVLIETANGWHRVEAEDGTRGWISANSTYSEVR